MSNEAAANSNWKHSKPASCGDVLEECEIWLSTPTGRKQIGSVPYCDKHKRIGGPVQTMKNSEVSISGTAWSTMLKNHPLPPYYFQLNNGQLVPESMRPVSQQPAPQELAANDKFDQDFE